MIDLVVSGATGRMGQAVARLVREAADLRVTGGIAPDAPADGSGQPGYPTVVPVEDAAGLVRQCQVVIDFSAPEQLERLVRLHSGSLADRALVIGTTGLEAELEHLLDRLAARAAVLLAANFSVGVNLLLGLVEQAARALPAADYEVEIVETHHSRKEDAPSGTALALGRVVAAARDLELDAVRRDGRAGRPGPRAASEIGFHAIRGGDVVGEHEVRFLGARERLTFGHTAQNRDLFAHGALVAARWIAEKGSGRYTMADVLGLVR